MQTAPPFTLFVAIYHDSSMWLPLTMLESSRQTPPQFSANIPKGIDRPQVVVTKGVCDREGGRKGILLRCMFS